QLWQANPLSRVVPFDAAEVARAFRQIWLDALRRPDRLWSNYLELGQQYTRIMTDATVRLWGVQPDAKTPVVGPDKTDKRFSAPDWERNAVLDAIKQTYPLTATTMLKTAAEIEGLDT